MTPHNQGLLKRLYVQLQGFTTDEQLTIATQFEQALNQYYKNTNHQNIHVTDFSRLNTAIWASLNRIYTLRPNNSIYDFEKKTDQEIIGDLSKIQSASAEMQSLIAFKKICTPLRTDLYLSILSTLYPLFYPSKVPHIDLDDGQSPDDIIQTFITLLTQPNHYENTLKSGDAKRFFDAGLIPIEIDGILESIQAYYDTLTQNPEFQKNVATLAAAKEKGLDLNKLNLELNVLMEAQKAARAPVKVPVILSSPSNNSNNGAQKMSDELNKMKI